MTGFEHPERQIPAQFATTQWNIVLVAELFQEPPARLQFSYRVYWTQPTNQPFEQLSGRNQREGEAPPEPNRGLK
jgi:hypothetical protein